jgi:hypothetical protein
MIKEQIIDKYIFNSFMQSYHDSVLFYLSQNIDFGLKTLKIEKI